MSASKPSQSNPQAPLSEQVGRTIEKRILSGKWAEGFKLPSEGKLCAEFDVSRTAVREAMRQLRGRGLVETINGSGSYVAGGQLETVSRAMVAYSSLASQEDASRDLIDFRIIIEGEAANRLAAQEDRSEALKTLDTIMDEMRAESGPKRFASLDLKFHLFLLSTSGNAFISMMGKALNAHYERFIKDSHKGADETLRKLTLEEHQRIVEAIREGQPDEARTAMRDHLSVAAIRWKSMSA